MSEVSQHEVKRRVLARFETVPLYRWSQLKNQVSFAGGKVSMADAARAVNELKADGKLVLFAGRGGAIYVTLPQYTEGIEAELVDRIAE